MEYTQNERALATYISKLYNTIENLEAEIKLRDAKIMKLKGDIFTLKSMIGHQNIYINNLQSESNIEDTTYEEDNRSDSTNLMECSNPEDIS